MMMPRAGGGLRIVRETEDLKYSNTRDSTSKPRIWALACAVGDDCGFDAHERSNAIDFLQGAVRVHNREEERGAVKLVRK